MANIITIGEPMGLMVADEAKALKDVKHFSRYVCGAEVNFSVGMARLGHEMSYISKVGKDPFGLHILDFLQEQHIHNEYVALDEEHHTGMQLKAKNPDGDPEVVNFRKNTAFSFFQKEELERIDWSKVDHLHLTGIPPALSQSCRETSFHIVKLARENGVQISFDTNLRPALWQSEADMIETINAIAAQSDIVLPGLSEGRKLTGLDSPEEIAKFYLDAGAKAVVIKLGPKGAYVNNGEEAFYSPAYQVTVVDTVGAGDGFAVGCVSGLLEGLSWKDAILRAAATGGLATTSEGDNEGLPTREQLEAFQKQTAFLDA